MKRSSSGRIDLPLAQGRNIFGWGPPFGFFQLFAAPRSYSTEYLSQSLKTFPAFTLWQDKAIHGVPELRLGYKTVHNLPFGRVASDKKKEGGLRTLNLAKRRLHRQVHLGRVYPTGRSIHSR